MFSLSKLFLPYQGMPKEIYVIFAARIVNALGCFVMPLMTIILTQSIGLSKESAGIYLSLTGLLYLPASLLGGKLADHIGRKRVILFFVWVRHHLISPGEFYTAFARFSARNDVGWCVHDSIGSGL